MDKVSYALGLGIGQQLAQMGASDLNIDDFADAIKDVINGNELKVPHKDAQTIVQEYFRQQEERINAIRAEQGKAAKAEGEKFLAENGKKEGVVTLKSGLQYEVLREGNGKKPKATDQVKCHYEGTLINGQVFDSSSTAATISRHSHWTVSAILSTRSRRARLFRFSIGSRRLFPAPQAQIAQAHQK